MRQRYAEVAVAARKGTNWPAYSLGVAVLGWILGHGGFALWDSRTIPRPPLQADYGHDLGLLGASLITLLLAPPIGMALSLWNLRRQPSRRLAAALAFLLNVWVWGLSLLMYPMPFSIRGLVWWTGVGIAVAGTIAAAYAVSRRVDDEVEPRGFPIEPTGLPHAWPEERR